MDQKPDTSSCEKIPASNTDAFEAKIAEAQAAIAAHDPDNVICMLACVVNKDGRVAIIAVGADNHLVQMLNYTADAIKTGISA